MPNNLNNKNTNKKSDKVCRICLQDEKFKISLLCPYAQQENIINRIEKYLQIKIPAQEQTPKYICYQCFANLKLIEKCVTSAQENQKFFKNSERNNENYLFEEECLQTPTESNEVEINNISYNYNGCTKNNAGSNVSNTSSRSVASTSILGTDTDSEQLFVPKTKPLPKRRKPFALKISVSEETTKKAKVAENPLKAIDTFIKQELVEEPEIQPEKSNISRLQFMKNFQSKFSTSFIGGLK